MKGLLIFEGAFLYENLTPMEDVPEQATAR